jgi:hypothetical protein
MKRSEVWISWCYGYYDLPSIEQYAEGRGRRQMRDVSEGYIKIRTRDGATSLTSQTTKQEKLHHSFYP